MRIDITEDLEKELQLVKIYSRLKNKYQEDIVADFCKSRLHFLLSDVSRDLIFYAELKKQGCSL